MNKKDKRMCWSCDGHVSFEHESCPYCTADLSQDKVEGRSESHLTPPYPAKDYGISPQEWEGVFKSTPKEEEKRVEPESKELLALLMLIPGIVFILFAVLLFVFSKDGNLELKWNESFAYFYFIGGLPLLVFGYRALQR